MMKKKSPFLLFDFATESGEKVPYVFEKPVAIYKTNKLTEVAEVFSQVEEACDRGYYVAGCVSYEAAPAFNPNISVHESSAFPLVWFGVFEAPIPYNEEEQSTTDFTVGDWEYDISYSEYEDAIAKIQTEIAIGNTSQINYTSRLRADFIGDDFSFYQQLARNQQASYTAYLNLGRYRVLSASPELFFRVDGNKITTKPMKGTIQRGRYEVEDDEQKQALANSVKDQIENAMIVDVLKDDLSKIAVPATVQVSKEFDIETYPTVHQMTSTIEAEIKQGTTIFDWFVALFPSGSITGDPKQFTMDYIRNFEPSPRGIYCGAIGFITPTKEAIFNVPIRTVMLDTVENQAIYGVGGGVTAKSTAAGEYDEMVVKARLLTERYPVFELLESIALIDGEYVLLENHLKRLKSSARYFNFSLSESIVRGELNKLQKEWTTGSYKVRLLLREDGKVSVTYDELQNITEPIKCKLASHPINQEDVFLYHKTTNRKVYEKHEITDDDVFSTLLWNERGEITEFTIGNIVVEIGGKFYTPPVESGLLEGTFRRQLLEEGEIKEKVIRKEDLVDCEAVYFINSVRGWLEVDME